MPDSTSGHSEIAIGQIAERSNTGPLARRSPTTSDHACAIQKIRIDETSVRVMIRALACSSNIEPTSDVARTDP